MRDFRQALDDFSHKRLILEELIQQLQEQLRVEPANAEKISALLDQQRRDNRIPVQVHAALTAIIEDKTITVHTHPPITGDTLNDRFVLEEVIGQGGMGVVYRARDLRKEEARDREPFVAIKVLNESVQCKPEAFIALQREAKKAQKLAHPNIATVYDFDRDQDTVYMTMELLEGESVGDLLKRLKPGELPVDEALSIIKSMGAGLAYAHQRGIVHADFKPGNAFIMNNREVKVLDFGIARAVKPSGQDVKEVTVFDPGCWNALTPAYASREMFEQAPPDPRDDIYALACVSYELLSGHHPFDRQPANAAQTRGLEPLRLPGLSRRQNQALKKALAFERSQRTPNVNQFLAELTSSDRPNTNAWTRTGTWTVSMVLIASVLGAGAHFLLNDKQEALAPPVSQPVATPPPQDPETLARIERLLEVADLHLSIGRLVEPKGSNAAEAYRAVDEIHPGNSRARAGLEEIVNRLDKQARQALERKDLVQAQSLLERGQQLLPDNPRLRELHKQLLEAKGD